MKSLIVLAALLLVLTPRSTATSQVRLVDPSTSRKLANGEKLKNWTHENNKTIEEYNQLLKDAHEWVNVDPEKLAPLAREMADRWEKIAALLEHYYEVDYDSQMR